MKNGSGMRCMRLGGARYALLVLIAALVGAAGGRALAQTYPERTVRIVVPFSPGGPADVIARILGDRLNATWGKPVVVDNRSGGGGNIGAELVAHAAPDGHTLLVNASNHVVNASLYERIGYDPLKDFTPIAELASFMLIWVVHPSVPVTTLGELVALARSQPGRVTVGNGGLGAPTHLCALLFAQAAGLDVVHVPYKGGAPAGAGVVGGQVMASCLTSVNALPQVRAGRLRALALASAERSSLVPELPTVAELGYPGFAATGWLGLFAPAHLPRDIVVKLHADTARALKVADVQEKLVAQGYDVIASAPDEFATFLSAEHDKWGKLIKSEGLRMD